MLQPAVKKETRNVTVITLIGVLLMLLVYFILHQFLSDKVPFDYTVILGAVGGGAIAVFNFFLMAVTVQKVASMEDRDEAGKLMKKSYSRRLSLQCLWIIVAVFAPCFNSVAGILPILFPGIGIKIYGIFRKDLKNTAPASEESSSDTSDAKDIASSEVSNEEAD